MTSMLLNAGGICCRMARVDWAIGWFHLYDDLLRLQSVYDYDLWFGWSISQIIMVQFVNVGQYIDGGLIPQIKAVPFGIPKPNQFPSKQSEKHGTTMYNTVDPTLPELLAPDRSSYQKIHLTQWSLIGNTPPVKILPSKCGIPTSCQSNHKSWIAQTWPLWWPRYQWNTHWSP